MARRTYAGGCAALRVRLLRHLQRWYRVPVTRPCRVGLREAIIEASLAIGTEVGEAGVTMRRIGGRLGVSATALYQHFESKEALLRELRLYGLMRLRETLEGRGRSSSVDASMHPPPDAPSESAVDQTHDEDGAWPDHDRAWQPTAWSGDRPGGAEFMHASAAAASDLRGVTDESDHSDAADPGDPFERCARLAERYVHFGRANPWLYSILMEHADIDWKTATPQERGELLAPLRLAQASVEEALRADPALAHVDAGAVSLQLWAGMHGLCSLLIHGRLSEDHPVFPVRDEAAMIRNFVRSLLGAFIHGTARDVSGTRPSASDAKPAVASAIAASAIAPASAVGQNGAAKANTGATSTAPSAAQGLAASLHAVTTSESLHVIR